MRRFEPVFLLVVLLLAGSTGFIFAQSDSTKVPHILNPDSDTIIYCSDSVYVASNISIENIQIDAADKGMQVSIVDFKRGEDYLGYEKVDPLKYNWNNSNGTLEISGVGTDEQYRDAVSKVYYTNLTNTRQVGVREFSISLLDADYLPYTKHFYQYIDKRGIRWTEAKTAAENMEYYGLQGYLATIMSSTENDFIWSKIDGVGWIGASDAANEGEWFWVTGPEAGTQFWHGNYTGYAVGGNFSYWNNGEPNNVHKSWGDYENYAHMVVAPGSRPKSWNDLSDEGDKDMPNGYYFPQGYVVEFGGMENLDLQLSATAYIEVRESQRPELDYSRVQTLFCGSKSETIELVFKGESPLVELISLDEKANVENPTTLQPTVSVDDYGYYKFQLNTIDEAGCPYTDTVYLEFHNQPEATFDLDSNECYGYNLQLAYTGYNDEEYELTWYYNDEVVTAEIDMDTIIIPLGFDDIERTVALKVNEQGCVASSSSQEVKVKPDIIVSAENTEGCSPVEVEFTAGTNKPAESYFWNFDNGNTSTEQNPSNLFFNSQDVLSSFSISLTVLDVKGCENTAFYDSLVRVYPVPTAGFNFSPEEALITDPEVVFTNTSHAATSYSWDFGDSTYSDQIDPIHRYDAMDVYTVTLEVANDFGCTDTISKPFTVTFDRLFPPNAFSPNASLEEDREFRIYGDGVLDEGYQLLIFNRWGEAIFESVSQVTGWDGKMENGSFAPAGVYTWVIQYTDFTGEKHRQQGNVTLIY